MFDLFRLTLPKWTDNFQEALTSVGELFICFYSVLSDCKPNFQIYNLLKGNTKKWIVNTLKHPFNLYYCKYRLYSCKVYIKLTKM